MPAPHWASDNRLGSCNAACGRYRRRHENGPHGRGAGHPSAELSLGSRGVMNRRTLSDIGFATCPMSLERQGGNYGAPRGGSVPLPFQSISPRGSGIPERPRSMWENPLQQAQSLGSIFVAVARGHEVTRPRSHADLATAQSTSERHVVSCWRAGGPPAAAAME